MVVDVLRLPEQLMGGKTHVLKEEIPAVQLVDMEHGHAHWGPLIRLPRGAELQECGDGFDDQTRLVRFSGCFYIVFVQDLNLSMHPFKEDKRAQAKTA